MTKVNYIKYESSHGGRDAYVEMKPGRGRRANRKQDYASDCAVRATAVALNQDYMQTLKELMAIALEMVLPSASSGRVTERYLTQKGFVKHSGKRDNQNRLIRLGDYAKFIDSTKSYWFTVRVGYRRHATGVYKGVNKDTWLCQDYLVLSYYER